MDDKLKKITFSKSLRGYSCDEVDTYIAYVTDKYEQRNRECTELRRQMALIAAKMNEYTDGRRAAAAEDERRASTQKNCDAMIDEARRQAARILADAEAEADVIRRRAEDNAQTIAANAAREGAKVVSDAVRSVAARNNAADRLVEEIDSFHEEARALYSRHLAELDRLATRTNAFYDRKTAVAETAEQEDTEIPDHTDADTIRIDWKNRTAHPVRDTAPTRDIVIDIPDEEYTDEEHSTDTQSADAHLAENRSDDETGADAAIDALFRSLTDKNMLSPQQTVDADGDEYEEPDFPATDDQENAWIPMSDMLDGSGMADADDAAYDDAVYDNAEDDEAFLSDFAESEDSVPSGTAHDSESADTYETPEDMDEEDETDMLLQALKTQYAAPPSPKKSDRSVPKESDRPVHKEPGRKNESRQNSNAPKNFDALFETNGNDAVQNVSMTGEFERIYGAAQPEQYVEEVGKQPLVPPSAPQKHK